MVCKKQVGHALSVPDREESHLLSEDLGSGEHVSRASAPKKKMKVGLYQGSSNSLKIDNFCLVSESIRLSIIVIMDRETWAILKKL